MSRLEPDRHDRQRRIETAQRPGPRYTMRRRRVDDEEVTADRRAVGGEAERFGFVAHASDHDHEQRLECDVTRANEDSSHVRTVCALGGKAGCAQV